MVRDRRWWLVSVSLVGVCAGVLVAVALAAPGDVTFVGCVSGDTAAGTGAGKNCANVPNSTAGGAASGLDTLDSVALSPDGNQLYAASDNDDAVVVLDRNPNSGALSFNSCVSGDTAVGTGAGKNCANVPNSAAGGAASGLNFLTSVALSPDGNQLYAASEEDDAVVVLDRNPNSGGLTFGSCVSGDTAAGTGAGKNCANVPNSTAGGAASGLKDLTSVALSPDGNQLYAASGGDDAVVALNRNPNSGALSFNGCVSGDTAAGTGAGKNCANVPNSTAGGTASGLDNLQSVALSPDGNQLYAASYFDDAVVVLDREPLPLPPGPGPGPPAMADTTPPVLSALSLSRKRFRVGAKPTPLTAQRKRTPAGTRVRYRLSEDAIVRLVVERRLAGRRTRIRGRTRCVKPTRRLARQKAKRCSRYRRRGTLSRAGKAGTNSFAFSGRIASRKLAPGSYRLRANATDAAGNSSNTRTVAFTITRR